MFNLWIKSLFSEIDFTFSEFPGPTFCVFHFCERFLLILMLARNLSAYSHVEITHWHCDIDP